MRSLRLALILCVLYLLADLSMNLYALGDGWAILWPLNGITVGLLLIRPRRDWPVIIGAIAVGVGLGEHYGSGNSIIQTLLTRIFSALEVLICALILPPFTTLEAWMRSPRLSLRMYCALVLGPGISAIPAALFAPFTAHQSFLQNMNDWATADSIGIVATLPFVLSVRTVEMRNLFRLRSLPRTCLILGLCFGTVYLIFSATKYPLFFLLYPVLLLTDLLLSFAGAALAALVASLLSIYLTIYHPAPVILHLAFSPTERNLALQAYLAFHLFALFPASIVFLERRWMTGQIKDANVQLTLLAATDGLTGVANRRAFDQRFDGEWRVGQRNRTPLSLLMIDLDMFKRYNDTYGHLAGDTCLQTIAGMLLEISRRPRDLAARYGGEEFIVMLPETSLEDALELAETLKSNIFTSELPHESSPWGRVTVSIGCVSAVPTEDSSPLTLLELADQALYRAKESGRNTIQTLDAEQTLQS